MEGPSQAPPPDYRSLMSRLMAKLEETERELKDHIDANINRHYRKKSHREQSNSKKLLKDQVDTTLNAFFDQIMEEIEVFYLLEDNRVQRRQSSGYLIESKYTPITLHRHYPKKVPSLAKDSTTLADSSTLPFKLTAPDVSLVKEEIDSSTDDDENYESCESSMSDEGECAAEPRTPKENTFGEPSVDNDNEDDEPMNENIPCATGQESTQAPIITTVEYAPLLAIKEEYLDDDDSSAEPMTNDEIPKTTTDTTSPSHSYSDDCTCETCVDARVMVKIQQLAESGEPKVQSFRRESVIKSNTSPRKQATTLVIEAVPIKSNSDDDDEQEEPRVIQETHKSRKRKCDKSSRTSAKRSKRTDVIGDSPPNSSDETNQKMINLYINCLDRECEIVFADRKMMFRHAINSHGIRPYKCSARSCGLDFMSPKLLTSHIRLCHDSDTQYVCDKCDNQQIFRSYDCCEVHWRRFHEPGSFKCATTEECTFVANIREDVTRHQRKSHRLFACKEKNCGSAFSLSCDLRNHELRHAEQTYHCTWPDCSKRTKCREVVVRHIKTEHFSSTVNMEGVAIVDGRDANDYIRIVPNTTK